MLRAINHVPIPSLTPTPQRAEPCPALHRLHAFLEVPVCSTSPLLVRGHFTLINNKINNRGTFTLITSKKKKKNLKNKKKQRRLKKKERQKGKGDKREWAAAHFRSRPA